MIGNYKRFDMTARPRRQSALLTPLIWTLCLPKVLMHRSKTDKSGMPKGLKPPFFLLCNHNAFMDFMVMTYAIWPRRANYVVAIDGFIGIEGLLRSIGGIGTRKFTTNLSLIRNMLAARDFKDVVVMFPEARYSLCGTSAVLPDSLGKMARLMNIPVVTLVMHGHHVNCPFWNKGNRGVKGIRSELKLLFTAEQTQSLDETQLNAGIKEALSYDDFAWQKENRRRVRSRKRAEGLHRLLYRCPSCDTEYRMNSKRTELFCEACGKRWKMTQFGELEAKNGQTEYSHIPDWYEWERLCVRREIENDSYCFEGDVVIESLPNAKGFIPLGDGRLVHNAGGFTLTGVCQGEKFTLERPSKTMYSCHIEYDYKGKGDCVDIGSLSDTFYVYPKGKDFSVTKMALATEELFERQDRKSGSKTNTK
jgi:transcription elongation factor Elf1